MEVVAVAGFVVWYRAVWDEGATPEGRLTIAAVNAGRRWLAGLAGPEDLERPRAAPIRSSRHRPVMWEYRHDLRRPAGRLALRVLFAVHDGRRAVLLVGGDKAGNWEAWYEVAIPTADSYYDHYLRSHRS